jgi:hypothetical protein
MQKIASKNGITKENTKTKTKTKKKPINID